MTDKKALSAEEIVRALKDIVVGSNLKYKIWLDGHFAKQVFDLIETQATEIPAGKEANASYHEYITSLKAQFTASQQETRRAVADIPHKCWSCGNGFHTDIGFDCDQAHYRGNNPDCLSWQWRGAQGAGEESR